MDRVRFREADFADADSIGSLHVASWREAYAEILPDVVLGSLSVAARSAMWRTLLTNSPNVYAMKVFIAEKSGEIVGFASCGTQRDALLREQGFDGEIGAIYVLKANQRAGIGTRLMSLMAETLVRQGRHAASLWVLSENATARAFYERVGGVPVGEKDDEISGVAVTEIAYGWHDLTAITP